MSSPRLAVSATLLLAACGAMTPRSRIVSGVVTDSVGRPVEGVTVALVGTATTVQTDSTGIYVLTVSREYWGVRAFVPGYRGVYSGPGCSDGVAKMEPTGPCDIRLVSDTTTFSSGNIPGHGTN